MLLKVFLKSAVIYLIHLLIGAALAQAVGYTIRCRDVFGPLTPVGDIRDLADEAEVNQGIGLTREGQPFGVPGFVVFVPDEGEPYRPRSVSSSDEITFFNFQVLLIEVQDVLKLEDRVIKEHVRNLFKWMSEYKLQHHISTAKMTSLLQFSEFFRMLFEVAPSFETLLAARTGIVPFHDGHLLIHQKVFAAARLQLTAQRGQQLLKWRDASKDSEKKTNDRTSRVRAYVVEMVSRGYTVEQAWWVLRTVIAAGQPH